MADQTDLPILASPPSIGPRTFAAILERAQSPALPHAHALWSALASAGIDPAVALAFYAHESSYGTRGAARITRSWGNNRRSLGRATHVALVSGSRGQFAHYATIPDALADWIELVKGAPYLGAGRETVEAIVPVYAPSSDGNAPARYVAAVRQLVEAYRLRERFQVDIRHWPDVASFRAHIAGYVYAATAPWARGVVIHHTAGNAAGWSGHASVAWHVNFYLDKGWGAGPHLFVAGGTRGAGIWQFTPLNAPGIHANAANAWTWGIEFVGTYDRQGWPADLAALGMGAAAALLDWAGVAASSQSITPHRMHNPGKTCPGRAIPIEPVIRGIAALQRT